MNSPPKKSAPARTGAEELQDDRVTNSCAGTSPNSMVEGHETTLLARFLVDEGSIRQYPNLKSEHFASPTHREIFSATRHSTTMVAQRVSHWCKIFCSRAGSCSPTAKKTWYLRLPPTIASPLWISVVSITRSVA